MHEKLCNNSLFVILGINAQQTLEPQVRRIEGRNGKNLNITEQLS